MNVTTLCVLYCLNYQPKASFFGSMCVSNIGLVVYKVAITFLLF